MPTRQRLGRGLPTQDVLAREVAAREHGRNVAEAGVICRFTTADAGTELARLYPALA